MYLKAILSAPRLGESGSHFSITNISENSLERLSVRDLCRTGLCKNPRKSASLPCPFKRILRSARSLYLVSSLQPLLRMLVFRQPMLRMPVLRLSLLGLQSLNLNWPHMTNWPRVLWQYRGTRIYKKILDLKTYIYGQITYISGHKKYIAKSEQAKPNGGLIYWLTTSL